MLSPTQHRLAQQVQNARFILATDLDGTFLGGSDDDRAALYDYLTDQSHTALVFVTGRDKDHVRHLIESQGVPRPHFVIGDVGTSVLDGRDLLPVQPVEAWIDRHWNGDEKARAALRDHEQHLTLQDNFGGRRRSYFISDRDKAYEAKAAVECAGYDAIVSDDTFFDVLPRGIQKGPTLRKLIEIFGLDGSKVLAAGDTLNDLSLFQSGLKSVAVGNREPDLDSALPKHEHVYRARGFGAAGIIEALQFFEFYVTAEPVL